MQAKIDELWPKTCITVAFLYSILCVITHTTQKLKVVSGRFIYLSNDCPILSEISILIFEAVYEIRSASYGSKHASQPLSDMAFNLCVLTLVTRRVYADGLHIKRLLYYWRCLFSALKLNVRYKRWVTPPNLRYSLFLIRHFCVYSIDT